MTRAWELIFLLVVGTLVVTWAINTLRPYIPVIIAATVIVAVGVVVKMIIDHRRTW